MTTTDVLVVGSGAAGLTAAITAALRGCRVIVVEKARQIGGTTAWSGGAAWLPVNQHMAAAGIIDSAAAASHYIRQLAGAHFDSAMVGAFLDNAPQMLSFLESNTTAVRFQMFPSFDYHPGFEGAARGRSIIPMPFDGRSIGPLLGRIRPPMSELTVFGGMQVEPAEAIDLQYSWKRRASFKVAAGLITRYAADRIRFGRGTRLIRGQALVARQLKSACDLGVDIRTGVAARALLCESGRVGGLTVQTEEGMQRIEARCGVILASGGFSANADLLAAHIPFAAQHVQMLPDTNRGEGLAMAVEAGAVLDGHNADNGIWMPASTRRRRDGTTARYPHFAFDRCKPGSIIVDAAGRRFVNEAASYHIVVRSMHECGAVPAWLIADHYFLRKYGMGMARPFPYGYRRHVEDGYLVQAATLADLAAKIGVNADGLESTVAKMNRYAQTGQDEDFGRGGDAYTRMLGDAQHGPNPCLGPVRKGPFYALALYPSDCGTVLGVRVNTHAQVLLSSGEPIRGLYACGLDMNSVLRGNYPGAGSMIGPAMTFGYVAANHLARSFLEAGSPR